MHLKNLEIQGFKSFADKINIEFGSGITGIVGPNGSGKSNISDAIRWVLGEQSAKSLRGGNMQDIIFSGTQKRKPLGFAEVSLTVDNTDKKLAIDYDEVKITRRVFRSGESEYFINKSSARLKDIHELFMDTGVGRDGYSIIGQGKIAEIVGAKSEDRRQIFEEASGITKFRYRKEEAERKLAHTHENVLRVSDIISELEIQVEPLKLQSEKAKKFLNFKEELKVLEVNVSLENIVKFKKALQEVDEVYDGMAEQLKSASMHIEQIEKDTNNLYENINQNEQILEQKRLLEQTFNQTLAEHQRDIGVLNSRIEYNHSSVKRIRQEISELNQKIDELENSLIEKDDGSEQIKQKEQEISSNIDFLNQQINQINKTFDKHNDETEEINTNLIEKMNEISNLRSKTGNYNAIIDSFKSRFETIENELVAKNDSYDSLKKNVESLENQINVKNNDILNIKNELSSKENDYNISNEEFVKIKTEFTQKQNILHQALSRQKILQDMANSFDNFNRSVKSVMQAHQSGELKALNLYGAVAQLVNVPNNLSTAIEVALGGSAQHIVTENENDAKKAIEYLKRTKQGRATFLPISVSKGNILRENELHKCIGYMGIASELINCDDKFSNLISGLLGRVVVVDNIDNAIIVAKKYNYKFRIVTLEGEVLSPGGSMAGGSKNTGAGLFARANELLELADKTKALKDEVLNLEHNEKELSEAIQLSKNELEKIKNNLRLLNDDMIKLTSDTEHSKIFLKSVEEGRNLLIAEKQTITNQIKDMNQDIDQYNTQIKLNQQEINELNEQSNTQKIGISTILEKRESLNSQLIEFKMQKQGIAKDIELHNERIQMVNIRKQEVLNNIQQKNENIAELLETNDDLKDDIDFKNQQIDDLKEELGNAKNEIAKAEAQRKKSQATIKLKQEEFKQQTEKQLIMQQEQGRMESKKAKAEVELETTINRLWEEYELTLTTATEYIKDIGTVANAQKRINELKEKIKELGNINIDAIEEYKFIKERFDFLVEQRADLVEAQKNLESVISQMVAIMKTQFTEKFKIINEHFNEVFVELFGGGKAQLKLTEPNDVLSSGVEIDVQPPGKAVKSMLQLSGGEQAFVSIALLFAILKVRPSPFCILDEIEAALDDVNVYRFGDYIKKFSGNSQFVIVTHRRGTMEAANVLYGVTMQEQGVSKLLSINIDDVVNS